MTFDIASIRADFPILSREVNGKPLVYLDNGASSQKPQVVIDAVTQAYAHEYANVHRGLHYLSNLATDKYEAVRGVVARFLNAGAETEIVLNSGTTEGINAVAYGWAMENLTAGDEIILSVMEHHANIVPWHFLRERLWGGVEMGRYRRAGQFGPASGYRCHIRAQQADCDHAYVKRAGQRGGCENHLSSCPQQGCSCAC